MKEIDEKEENQNESDFIFYHKVNIFGNTGVGKSTLISLMENYNNKDNNDNKDSLINRNLNQIRDYSYTESNPIVEQIKKVKIVFNNQEKNNEPLYLNVYETDLDKYNTIKMNLDTLLFQTECIIIMWDNSEIDSFHNINDFIGVIVSGIKEKIYNNVPIFAIKNKIDLNIHDSQLEFDQNSQIKFNYSIKEVIKKYKDYITYKEISLLTKDNFNDLIPEISEKLKDNKKDNKIGNEAVKNVKLLKEPKSIGNIKNDKEIKCILLGDAGVGKTSFVKKIKGKDLDTKLTIGFEETKISAEINKEKVEVQLFDTAGQEKFRSIPKNYYKDVDSILLMFDVTNKDSFEAIEQWISSIKDNVHNSKIILIGNKIDLNEKRIINKKDAQKKADDHNIKYYECSCFNGINIDETLNELLFVGYIYHCEKQNDVNRQLKNSFQLKRKNKDNKDNTIYDDYEIIEKADVDDYENDFHKPKKKIIFLL